MSARRSGIGILGLSLALVLLLVACAGATPTPSTSDSGVWLVEVEGEGGVWLGPQTLHSLGVNVQQDAAPVLRLSQAGREVAYQPVATEEGWGLWFFAPDLATRYTRRTAFRLEVGTPGETLGTAGPPEPAGAETVPGGASPELKGGLVSAHWEQDRRYLPQAEAEVPWLWQPLAAPGSLEHTVVLTGAVSGPLTVTLHLWSHSASPTNPDHLLHLYWDGRRVGEWTWDGMGMQHLTASVPAEEAEPGAELGVEHTLSIEMPGLPDGGVEVIWLDGVQVAYRRRVDAGGPTWQAQGTALRLDTVEPSQRLFDVTKPLAPLDLGPVPGTQDTGGLVGTVPGHRYWLGVPEGSRAPVALHPAGQVDLAALEGVQYLALAAPEFQPALAPLLEHRRAQGLAAVVVDPQAVYDVFGTGQPDPEAVRALVGSLSALRYLLLVGDGASEQEGYDGQIGALRVVAPVTRTAVLGETPADGLLAIGPQGQPLVAVGRFPATSADEVARMVDKTLAWENRAGAPAILMLSDDEPQFVTMTEEIMALVPEGDGVQWVDVAQEGSRQSVLAALEREPTWLNFSGHGSPTLLCDEGTLTIEDGETWRQPAVVVAWSCLAAHFTHPTQDSIGEVWMRAPEGGAVAFLGPVGETTPSEQQPFALAFYAALQEEARMGDAWRAASQVDGSRDVALGYVLLGDPALELDGK